MIREATEKDLGAILKIYNDAILHTTAVYDYKAHTLADRTAWYESKRRDGYPLLVLEEDQQVVAYATFGPFRAWPAYKYTIEHSVYVHEDYRHRGFATQLMKKLITIADAGGYATLVAGIDAANAGSIKMHEKLGFTLSGVIKKAGYKFHQWLDLAFYQLPLQGPKTPSED